MVDREKVIQGLGRISEWLFQQYRVVYDGDAPNYYDAYKTVDEAIELLKEQETEWEHLWDAPDGTFKGRCKKCGFVHFFIEGHDGQYKFCPECGRAVKWDD